MESNMVKAYILDEARLKKKGIGIKGKELNGQKRMEKMSIEMRV